MIYRDQLRDRRWQQRRLEIMARDGWKCQEPRCIDKHNPRVMLVVHHLVYKTGHMAWEYDARDLITLCQRCHDRIHRRQWDVPVSGSGLKPHDFYAWHELEGLLGFRPHGYLTAVGPEIVCGCFRMDLNPDAPDIVLPGNLPNWRTSAMLLSYTHKAIPIFTKAEGLPWEYRGKYRASGTTTAPVELEIHNLRSGRKDVSMVLFLEPVS